jgi:superfamily II RNA helicase
MFGTAFLSAGGRGVSAQIFGRAFDFRARLGYDGRTMKFREYESGGGGEFELDPFQVEAIEAVDAGQSVLVAAPTGAGKTVIAEYAVELALQRGERVIYTAPIKALSNQKFRDFRSRFGDQVGIMTGDVTINGSAPALIMTTEIFRNALFEESGRFDDARFLIFDEVHYINDLERGTVWEESIIFAPSTMQLVCLSATMPNVRELADWIAEVRGSDVRVVRETHRPVPLRYHILCGDRIVSLNRLDQAMRNRADRGKHRDRRRESRRRRTRRSDQATADVIDILEEQDHLPCIYFCFSRAACEAKAWKQLDRNLLSEDEHRQITALFDDLCEKYEIADELSVRDFRRLVSRGIAYHHAGMLPTIKEVVERLFSSGFIKLIFATETFAVGINMPARTVAFDSLRKFDGVKFDYMQSREYHQMSGRAGRRGMDKVGYVYAVVDPEEDDAKRVRRVLTGQIERILSRFELAYSTILNLYSRVGEAVYEACARSFAHFQRRHHRRPGIKPEQEKKLAKKKIGVLRDLGYLIKNGVRRKGQIAAAINGYELQVAEMYADGLLDRLNEDELSVLMVAVVYEARRRSRRRRLPKKQLRRISDPAHKAWARIRSAEKHRKVEELTQRPDFGLSLATWHWSRGCEFDQLEHFADVGPGDLCRYFRLAIQLMRQTIKAVAGDTRIIHKLRESIDRLNRDVVDAERQLRVE